VNAGIVFNLTGASGQTTASKDMFWGAFPNDFVCVTPARSKKAAIRTRGRRESFGAQRELQTGIRLARSVGSWKR